MPPADDVQLRPETAAIRKRVWVVLPAEVGAIGLASIKVRTLTSSTTGRTALWAVMILILIGLAALTVAYARRVRVVVTPVAVRYDGLLRYRLIPRSEVQRALRWTSNSFHGGPSQRLVLTRSNRHRPPFVLDSALWGAAGLDGLIGALSVPVEEFPDAATASATHPKAVPWRDEHPVGVVGVLTGVVLVVVFLGVLTYMVATGQ